MLRTRGTSARVGQGLVSPRSDRLGRRVVSERWEKMADITVEEKRAKDDVELGSG